MVVHVGERSDGKTIWRISHESSYREYVESLMPTYDFQSSLDIDPRSTQIAFVSLESLHLSAILDGRSGVTIARLEGDIKPQTKYVYKGLSFQRFLEIGSGFSDERRDMYHELGLIYSLPNHPNIVSRPDLLVIGSVPTVNNSLSTKCDTSVCGALYRYLESGSL